MLEGLLFEGILGAEDFPIWLQGLKLRIAVQITDTKEAAWVL
jgi:hypothetical protein